MSNPPFRTTSAVEIGGDEGISEDSSVENDSVIEIEAENGR